MAIKVSCECGSTFEFGDALAGKAASCACGRSLAIPDPEAVWAGPAGDEAGVESEGMNADTIRPKAIEAPNDGPAAPGHGLAEETSDSFFSGLDDPLLGGWQEPDGPGDQQVTLHAPHRDGFDDSGALDSEDSAAGLNVGGGSIQAAQSRIGSVEPIRVTCECGVWFDVRAELAGRKGKCACGRIVRIPGKKIATHSGIETSILHDSSVAGQSVALDDSGVIHRSSRPAVEPLGPAAVEERGEVLRVHCPCGAWFDMKRIYAGRKGRCACGRVLRIPLEYAIAERDHSDPTGTPAIDDQGPRTRIDSVFSTFDESTLSANSEVLPLPSSLPLHPLLRDNPPAAPPAQPAPRHAFLKTGLLELSETHDPEVSLIVHGGSTDTISMRSVSERFGATPEAHRSRLWLIASSVAVLVIAVGAVIFVLTHKAKKPAPANTHPTPAAVPAEPQPTTRQLEQSPRLRSADPAAARGTFTPIVAAATPSRPIISAPAPEKPGEIARYSDSTTPIEAAALSPDLSRVATGGEDGILRIWDRKKTMRPIVSCPGHSGVIHAIVYSPDGRFIATAGEDSTVRIWEAHSGKAIKKIDSHTAAVRCIAFSPDGAMLASGGEDNLIRVHDPGSGAELFHLSGHGAAVTGAAFSPDGADILSASEDRTIRIWSVKSRAETARIAGHSAPIQALAVSPVNGQVATGAGRFGTDLFTGQRKAQDCTLRIWNLQDRREVRLIDAFKEPVASVAFSPDGSRIAGACADGSVRIFEASSGVELAHYGEPAAAPAFSVVFSSDGKYLLSTHAAAARLFLIGR